MKFGRPIQNGGPFLVHENFRPLIAVGPVYLSIFTHEWRRGIRHPEGFSPKDLHVRG